MNQPPIIRKRPFRPRTVAQDKNIASVYESTQWHKHDIYLQEACHLFEVPNTIYRETIIQIAKALGTEQNLIERDVPVYGGDSAKYDCYEFLNPFEDIDSFNIINKLTVFYSTKYDTGAYIHIL